MNTKKLQSKIEELVAKASFSMRKDVSGLLLKAWKTESSKRAKKALGWILENAKIASSENLALCQDTGFPVVFIEAGKNVKVDSGLIETIKKGIILGYRRNFLRASIVDPLQRENPVYDSLIYHIDFSSKHKDLKITLFPKGFGSENKSKLMMFNPTASWQQIESFIVESVKLAGPESCPPFIVGVGIGATSDGALLLAKKSLLGDINKANPDKSLNILEKQLLKKINTLKIGPMGFGGKTTALAVKINKAPTHIAGLPIGINISCWALRSAAITVQI